MNIRIAKVEDAKELLEIYTPYIIDTAITFEYEVPSVDEFEGRIRGTLQRYPYLVLEDKGAIMGYAYASAFKERAAYDWSIETSIYIRKDAKNCGYGRALYEELETLLKKQNVKNVNACIAYTQVEDAHLTNDSVSFHEHLGYKMVGCFHECGYKFGHWYDMVWMEKMIGIHEDCPEDFIPFKTLMNA